jgi:hypothetical protein
MSSMNHSMSGEEGMKSPRITQSLFHAPLSQRMNYGRPPPNLGSTYVNPKDSKNYDHDFGFNMIKLSKNEASKVAKLLIKDASKHVGSRCRQM